jgi:hypothetical protein
MNQRSEELILSLAHWLRCARITGAHKITYANHNEQYYMSNALVTLLLLHEPFRQSYFCNHLVWNAASSVPHD